MSGQSTVSDHEAASLKGKSAEIVHDDKTDSDLDSKILSTTTNNRQSTLSGEEKSSRRPKDTAFHQQRLPAWQPILTPYNVIPALFLMALLFVPLGFLFTAFSGQVQEYSFDYSSCLQKAPLDKFGPAPESLGSVPFQWRRLSVLPSYAQNASPDLSSDFTPSSSLCELKFTISQNIPGPVFQYYRLSNFYQNQRLYVKSINWDQLSGEAKPYDALSDCMPIVGPDGDPVNPDTGKRLVFYPCGLIANSYFNDTIGALALLKDGSSDATNPPEAFYTFPPRDISWPHERDKYGPTKYAIGDIRPPPAWLANRRLVNDDGTYKTLPDLQNDERFMNWIKVAGLPVFRKTYGRHPGSIPAGTYSVLISSEYEVTSYGATKSLVISNTTWMGGRNYFLGYAYIIAGTLFLACAIAFLIRHLLAPRRLGDLRYLSWNQDPVQH